MHSSSDYPALIRQLSNTDYYSIRFDPILMRSLLDQSSPALIQPH